MSFHLANKKVLVLCFVLTMSACNSTNIKYDASFDCFYSLSEISNQANEETCIISSVSSNTSFDTKNSSSVDSFTDSSCSNDNKQLLTVATWNIGHFSNGAYPYSSLTSYSYCYYDYLGFVSGIDADIFSINEYSQMMVCDSENILTKDVVFYKYDFQYEFQQNNYCCNSIFAKMPLDDINASYFECNKNASLSNGLNANDYYFVESTFSFNNLDVTLVSLHCALDTNNASVAENQYKELIERYKDKERIIILGDFNNTVSNSQIDIFSENGYLLSNSFGSHHFSSYRLNNVKNKELDNVIVKGFEIADVGMCETNLSDHNAIKCSLYCSW